MALETFTATFEGYGYEDELHPTPTPTSDTSEVPVATFAPGSAMPIYYRFKKDDGTRIQYVWWQASLPPPVNEALRQQTVFFSVNLEEGCRYTITAEVSEDMSFSTEVSGGSIKEL